MSQLHLQAHSRPESTTAEVSLLSSVGDTSGWPDVFVPSLVARHSLLVNIPLLPPTDATINLLGKTELISRIFLLLLAGLLTGCASMQQPITNPVTWYAINNAGAMRIVVYDFVCDRRMGSVRLSGRGETAITVCGDEDGRADFRYRPDGYQAMAADWVRQQNIRSNQRIFIQ